MDLILCVDTVNILLYTAKRWKNSLSHGIAHMHAVYMTYILYAKNYFFFLSLMVFIVFILTYEEKTNQPTNRRQTTRMLLWL